MAGMVGQNTATHLAAEDEGQEQGHRKLGVAEKDDVQQIRIGRRLQEEPVCEGVNQIDVPISKDWLKSQEA